MVGLWRINPLWIIWISAIFFTHIGSGWPQQYSTHATQLWKAAGCLWVHNLMLKQLKSNLTSLKDMISQNKPITQTPETNCEDRLLLVDGEKAQLQTTKRIEIFFDSIYPYSTVYLALLCMMLAPVGPLGGTRGHASVQQAIANCCKGVHPYS